MTMTSPHPGSTQDYRLPLACVDGGSGVEPGDAMRSSTTKRRTRWYQSILLIQDSLHRAVAKLERAVGPCEPASTCLSPSFREPLPYLTIRDDVLGETDTKFVAESSSLASRGAHERKFAARKSESILVTSRILRRVHLVATLVISRSLLI
jgi:hypothetical protein